MKDFLRGEEIEANENAGFGRIKGRGVQARIEGIRTGQLLPDLNTFMFDG